MNQSSSPIPGCDSPIRSTVSVPGFASVAENGNHNAAVESTVDAAAAAVAATATSLADAGYATGSAASAVSASTVSARPETVTADKRITTRGSAMDVEEPVAHVPEDAETGGLAV
jgi:hypothetical protein